jgi:hypothetical protein
MCTNTRAHAARARMQLQEKIILYARAAARRRACAANG